MFALITENHEMWTLINVKIVCFFLYETVLEQIWVCIM